MTTKEKVKVFFLAVLMLWIVLVIASGNSYGQSASVKYHNKIQKERSFETWEKNQPKTRIKAVKDAVEQSKDAQGANSESQKLRDREAELRKKIVNPVNKQSNENTN